MKSKDKVVEQIKKLLELGDSSRNTSEEEAKAALLKAQELMAKYDISAEEVDEPEEEAYSHEVCEHKWDYAYRIPLAQILAQNFRCMTYNLGKKITFMGHPSDAKICKATFEYAYKFIQTMGNRVYNKRYQMGLPTKGVFNSYAHGFLQGLKEAFAVQCQALQVITPPDVIEEFKEMSKNWATKRSKRIEANDYEAWRDGKRDGKSFMEKDKLPQ